MSDDEDNKTPEMPEAALDEARVDAAVEELTQATLKFEREVLLEWWADEAVYDPLFPRGATLESSMREALVREARASKVVQLGDRRDFDRGPRDREPFYSEKATEQLVDFYLLRVKLLQASREAIAEVLRRREEAKKGG